MRPPEVLDHQATLIDYLDSTRYHRYMDSFTADMVRKGKVNDAITGTDLCRTVQQSLRVAQAFHVQSEMMPLLRAASVDLEDDDHLVHDRLPAEHGFLLFNEPWLTTDVWGATLTMAGFQWRHGSANLYSPAGVGSHESGIWLTYFADLYDERDEVTQGLIEKVGMERMQELGRWHINHVTFLPYHQPVGPLERPNTEDYSRFATEGLTLATNTPNTERMVVALFRLLTQVIVEVADAPIDRPLVRRMTRKNLPARVQTVKLRRKERIRDDEPHGDGHVDWQHSWAVRGHWAWRACRQDHPTAEPYDKGWHTRVYVAPYFKGPDDKPLKISEKVWGLAQ
jgi:hypothetical protein